MSLAWLYACRNTEWGRYMDLKGPVIGLGLLIVDAILIYSFVAGS